MAKQVCPILLAWFITKGEEDAKKDWWPEFITILEKTPKLFIETVFESLPEISAKAFTELNIYVEIEFTYEFAESIVVGVREHFIKEVPVQ